MKLCIDCKWIIQDSRWVLRLCDSPQAKHSCVDGRPLEGAEELRRFRDCGCGPDAKWFEQK